MGHDEHGPAYPEPTPVYRCPICRGDENRYLTCEYPGCLDGRDFAHPHRRISARYPSAPSEAWPPRVKCPGFLLATTLLIGIVLGACLFALVRPAHGMDHGFDPIAPTTKWMESLQRPDKTYPGSCCGIADAYQADTYVKNPDGSYEVVITDGSRVEYPDGSFRTPIDDGTKIHVPKANVNPEWERAGNPTGHAWLFMSVYGVTQANGARINYPGQLYCFVPILPGS